MYNSGLFPHHEQVGPLIQTVIASTPAQLTAAVLRLFWSLFLRTFAQKVCSFTPYTFIPPFAPFIKPHNCSLSMHLTFTSLNSSKFSMHFILIPTVTAMFASIPSNLHLRYVDYFNQPLPTLSLWKMSKATQL